MLRKIYSVLLVLCLALGLCACGQQQEQQPEGQVTEENHMIYLEDGRVVYRVTVVDETGQALPDVLVGICLGEELCADLLTNAQGSAEYIHEQDAYTVRILAAPAGYAMPDDPFIFPAGYSETRIILPKA